MVERKELVNSFTLGFTGYPVGIHLECDFWIRMT